jgi:hypothetical protein
MNCLFKKHTVPFIGFIQATLLFLYIFGVNIFLVSLGQKFDNEVGSLYGPMLFLLLFIISAVISATIVLGRAGVLFWEKKYKEAFTILGWTIFWAVFYFGLCSFFIIFGGTFAR